MGHIIHGMDLSLTIGLLLLGFGAKKAGPGAGIIGTAAGMVRHIQAQVRLVARRIAAPLVVLMVDGMDASHKGNVFQPSSPRRKM